MPRAGVLDLGEAREREERVWNCGLGLKLRLTKSEIERMYTLELC